MKAYLWFWGAFLLFFALPFPCILYFGTSWPVALVDRSAPWLALLLLALSLNAWLALLLAFLHTLLLGPPRALHRVHSILADGEPRDALIEHAEQTGVQVRGFAQWKLQLSFQNLSGTPIREQLLVVDSKPQLHRFEVGRHIDARLNRMPGAFPNVVLDGAQPELNVASLWRRSIGAAIGIVLVAAAYVAAYRLQSEGLGWTFLSFGHPLLVCPLVLCGYILGLRLLGRLLQADARGDALKYRGIGVEARVLKVRQTGTYLNEQPQVEFQLEYTDRDGDMQRASVRRFIPLIDLANIPREHVTLLYDPDDHGNVRLEGV
ncbi:hypothetical protein N5C16_14290 [Stenotrophomonas sp. GD03908]|uniref:Transmembrane protein n=1 Tax=Stenotrophomonas maltophilia TaxID=40324 RepID=A0AAJ2TLW1_STEMA|nr:MULTISPECIES: hypothetical protein [Stenotrophomonas]MBH1483447.1 hypothetical protein [Stenotrophomonas maltophilia]MDH0980443.1 hypothetical protein [Stenotrophomonas sp. GD03908]MDQ7292585.1 hypothetical protein [Stenotrophomonas sp. Sm0041]MDZ5763626.1 hypothetical protein [Stenotrophomonas maltophilia]HDS1533500.1 hypothetical protein [Stenotrophomonas maltophilia]